MFFGHEFGGIGLEVEAEQGLGVRWADIEPPVGIFDFETIEFVLLPVSILLLERSEDSILVVDFAVDLA